MKDFTNRQRGDASAIQMETALNRRIMGTMVLAVALAVAISAIIAPWRIATGLLLGGVLSLLSYRWMTSSIKSAFKQIEPGERPQIGAAQYILRYFVIGFSVYLAYRLNIVYLPAAIAGLCSFVVALFVEAIREFYFIIVHREELG